MSRPCLNRRNVLFRGPIRCRQRRSKRAMRCGGNGRYRTAPSFRTPHSLSLREGQPVMLYDQGPAPFHSCPTLSLDVCLQLLFTLEIGIRWRKLRPTVRLQSGWIRGKCTRIWDFECIFDWFCGVQSMRSSKAESQLAASFQAALPIGEACDRGPGRLGKRWASEGGTWGDLEGHRLIP